MPCVSMDCLNQVKVWVLLVRSLDLDVWDQLRSHLQFYADLLNLEVKFQQLFTSGEDRTAFYTESLFGSSPEEIPY